MANPLSRAARVSGDQPALSGAGRAWTYRELHEAVGKAKAHLSAVGWHSGQRAAITAEASPELVMTLWAAWELGLQVCLVNRRWPEAAIRANLTAIHCQDRLEPVDTEVSPEATALPWRDEWELAQPASLIFTSGSTDQPKAALHTLGNHLANAAASNQVLPLRPGDRWLLTLPLYHVGGLAILFRCLLVQACVVIPDPARSLADVIAEEAITHVSLVPTQLRRLLAELPAAGSASLRAILVGGAPVPGELLRQARQRGLPVVSTYGCTEASSQVATARLDGAPETMFPLPGQQVTLGADGEVLLQGPALFAGYVTADGLDPVRDGNGWYHTGDLGWLADDGSLLIHGRRDNLFISGGENIQPEEIERVLREHPGVEEAIVVPVPDAEFGERPFAFLGATGEALPAPEDLDQFLADKLPRFKQPVGYAPLPPLGDGRLKPNRHDLTERAGELHA